MVHSTFTSPKPVPPPRPSVEEGELLNDKLGNMLFCSVMMIEDAWIRFTKYGGVSFISSFNGTSVPTTPIRVCWWSWNVPEIHFYIDSHARWASTGLTTYPEADTIGLLYNQRSLCWYKNTAFGDALLPKFGSADTTVALSNCEWNTCSRKCFVLFSAVWMFSICLVVPAYCPLWTQLMHLHCIRVLYLSSLIHSR